MQVYPGVEYDFIPNDLTLGTNDFVHIQWTGSNTHNNGNPGGDGQIEDDGQGQTGTDRNNFVQVNDLNENFPLPYEMSTIWKDVELIGILNDLNFTDDASKYLRAKNAINSNDLAKDLALYFSTSSYYECVKKESCNTKSYESVKEALDANLNNAPASIPGALMRFTNANRAYYYICSRNNNFSNRSQKGTLTIR